MNSLLGGGQNYDCIVVPRYCQSLLCSQVVVLEGQALRSKSHGQTSRRGSQTSHLRRKFRTYQACGTLYQGCLIGPLRRQRPNLFDNNKILFISNSSSFYFN